MKSLFLFLVFAGSFQVIKGWKGESTLLKETMGSREGGGTKPRVLEDFLRDLVLQKNYWGKQVKILRLFSEVKNQGALKKVIEARLPWWKQKKEYQDREIDSLLKSMRENEFEGQEPLMVNIVNMLNENEKKYKKFMKILEASRLICSANSSRVSDGFFSISLELCSKRCS